jgi:hypothetical protein
MSVLGRSHVLHKFPDPDFQGSLVIDGFLREHLNSTAKKQFAQRATGCPVNTLVTVV